MFRKIKIACSTFVVMLIACGGNPLDEAETVSNVGPPLGPVGGILEDLSSQDRGPSERELDPRLSAEDRAVHTIMREMQAKDRAENGSIYASAFDAVDSPEIPGCVVLFADDDCGEDLRYAYDRCIDGATLRETHATADGVRIPPNSCFASGNVALTSSSVDCRVRCAAGLVGRCRTVLQGDDTRCPDPSARCVCL